MTIGGGYSAAGGGGAERGEGQAVELAATLDDIAEQIAELGLDELRAQVDQASYDDPEADGSRPQRRGPSARERKLASARRSVLKAAAALREAG